MLAIVTIFNYCPLCESAYKYIRIYLYDIEPSFIYYTLHLLL